MKRTIDPHAVRWAPSRGFINGNRWECWRGIVYQGRVFQAHPGARWTASRVLSKTPPFGVERSFESVADAANFVAGAA